MLFDDYYFEAVLSKHMLILTNKDVPGVIGNLGNVLEKHHINIAGFSLGQLKEKGTAVSVVNIDSPPTNETLRDLRDTPNILEVHCIVL